jgi:pimeloyl-ACP methyl ester carboxylesterase/predicted glycosyltransferase
MSQGDRRPITAFDGEQTRACYPDDEGYVDRDGVRVFWERYGEGDPAVLLLPTWEIVPSRMWKCQIPYLARHATVVTFDPRGNGRSDRPRHIGAYDRRQLAGDALAVLDAAGVDRAAIVSWCGSSEELILAAEHPDRVTHLVEIAPNLLLTMDPERAAGYPFDDELDTEEGWSKTNRHYWLRDWPGYVRFFFEKVFSEPHSTKQIEDSVGWGLETDPETMVLGVSADWENDQDRAFGLCAQVRCPTVVVQGTHDEVVGPERGAAVAGAIEGARLVILEGCGHGSPAREPVRINRILRDAICPPPPADRWARGPTRSKRALFVSSPIGLGHARRDLAIADELRILHPDLTIEWLAQEPVTTTLMARGERIHPMSRYLANESNHIQREAHGHELHAFEALRRMDEIQVANFMVFQDLVRDEPFDVWIGDEAWEIDYYLHENPEEKRAPFAWLTDFVGYLPMPDGGEREASLTADYNLEMIEHIDRFPRVRDTAIFVGDPDDIVPDSFGSELPAIREWTTEHFEFSGYVTGFRESAIGDQEALRSELGYGSDERVCVVTVGGSGVGATLLRRVIEAYPEAEKLVPGLRMLVVAGPRIDPASLPAPAGVEVRAYVDDLYRHLAACDVAVVQGGLATCMELVASRRPFLYFPLKNHFEQERHVRHRLDRHRAGTYMSYETATPVGIAAAIAQAIDGGDDYLPVDGEGARRAARLIAELLC